MDLEDTNLSSGTVSNRQTKWRSFASYYLSISFHWGHCLILIEIVYSTGHISSPPLSRSLEFHCRDEVSPQWTPLYLYLNLVTGRIAFTFGSFSVPSIILSFSHCPDCYTSSAPWLVLSLTIYCLIIHFSHPGHFLSLSMFFFSKSLPDPLEITILF